MDTRPGWYGEASGVRQKRGSNQEAVAMIYINYKYDGVEVSGAENTSVDRSHVS